VKPPDVGVRVLVLGPGDPGIMATLAGHAIWHIEGPLREHPPGCWIGVSCRYRHIVPAHVLRRTPIVNLHASALPHNRGAHPNFWAWFDGTPHGVSLHWMRPLVDAGPIIAQEMVPLDEDMTLRTSYWRLHRALQQLFARMWPRLVRGHVPSTEQRWRGRLHRAEDLPREVLVDGWDTKCRTVAEAGAEARG